MIDEMRRQSDEMGLVEFYDYVCRRSGYAAMLQEKEDAESRGRLENVEELSSSIQAFLENDPEDPTLSGFLDEVALYTDLDGQEAGDNCVTLMTMPTTNTLGNSRPLALCMVIRVTQLSPSAHALHPIYRM